MRLILFNQANRNLNGSYGLRLCENANHAMLSGAAPGASMAGYIEGTDRGQTALFPERLDDWIDDDHLVRVVDLFVEQLDLQACGF